MSTATTADPQDTQDTPAGPATGFDLSVAKAAIAREDEGIVVAIHTVQGEPMQFGEPRRPVTMTVVGTYSERYRTVLEEHRAKLTKRKAPMTLAEQERAGREIIAACVLAWDGFFNAGTPLSLNLTNVLAVFAAAPWIVPQLEEAMGDHARFFASSSSN